MAVKGTNLPFYLTAPLSPPSSTITISQFVTQSGDTDGKHETSVRVSQLTWTDMTYLLTAIGLTPGGSSTVHIYTKTIQRTTQ
jgi:hypothetical protein